MKNYNTGWPKTGRCKYNTVLEKSMYQTRPYWKRVCIRQDRIGKEYVLDKTVLEKSMYQTRKGKNASEVGGEILNNTGEAVQKIGAGAAGVLGNITGEIKEGISGNSSR